MTYARAHYTHCTHCTRTRRAKVNARARLLDHREFTPRAVHALHAKIDGE